MCIEPAPFPKVPPTSAYINRSEGGKKKTHARPILSRSYMRNETALFPKLIVHLWMRHATNTHESYYTTLANETCHTIYAHQNSPVPKRDPSDRIYAWVIQCKRRWHHHISTQKTSWHQILSTVDTASPAHLYMGLRKEKEKNVVWNKKGNRSGGKNGQKVLGNHAWPLALYILLPPSGAWMLETEWHPSEKREMTTSDFIIWARSI